MKLLRKLYTNVVDNLAEYYTLFAIVVALPLVAGSIVGFKWGLLLSFILQSIIGMFYIKGRK